MSDAMELERLRDWKARAERWMWLNDIRPCDIAACNCGLWHGGEKSWEARCKELTPLVEERMLALKRAETAEHQRDKELEDYETAMNQVAKPHRKDERMICLHCNSEKFARKENALIEQAFRGETFMVKAPAMVCTKCGWQALAEGMADELLKRTGDTYRQRHGWPASSAGRRGCRRKPAATN